MQQAVFIPDTSGSIPCTDMPEATRLLRCGRRPDASLRSAQGLDQPDLRSDSSRPSKFPNVLLRTILKQRMTIFGLTPEALAEKAFVDLSTVNGLLDGSIQRTDVDELDFARISSALSANPDVLSGDATDFLSKPSEYDTPASLLAKARLQQMLDDHAFIQSVLDEH